MTEEAPPKESKEEKKSEEPVGHANVCAEHIQLLPARGANVGSYGKHKENKLSVSGAKKGKVLGAVESPAAIAACGMIWWEIHRPQRLEEITGQPHVATLKRMIEGGCLPHLVLHGGPGTGKTSVANSLPRALYEDDWKDMAMVLNAADDTGVEFIRSTIREFAVRSNARTSLPPYAPRLLILDEADRMSHKSQQALVQLIGLYPHIRVCLMSNSPARIIEELFSECTSLPFGPLSPESIRNHVAKVAAKQGVTMTEAATEVLVSHADGDLRRALASLQTCATEGADVIDEKRIFEVLAIPPRASVQSLLATLRKGDSKKSSAALKTFIERQGYSMPTLLLSLYRETIALDPKGFDPTTYVCFFEELARLEERSQLGVSDKILLGELACFFCTD